MKTYLSSAMVVASLCFASATFAEDIPQPAPILDVTQTPDAVQTTLRKQGARVDKVMEKTENGKRFYEATLSKDNKNYLLRVAADGKVLKRESMK